MNINYDVIIFISKSVILRSPGVDIFADIIIIATMLIKKNL